LRQKGRPPLRGGPEAATQSRPTFLLALGALLAALAASVLPDGAAAPAPAATLPQVEALHHKAYRERLPGSKMSLEMVPIPGGVYLLGSPAGEKGRRADEGPQRRVRVRPFWMAKVEVTWDVYDLYWKTRTINSEKYNEEALARDADAITRPTLPYIDETRGYGREGYAALAMTHHAAMEFCRWLSKATGKAYRLPLECEWEWACRAGSKSPYGFGDDAAKLGEHAWYEKNAKETPHPVGKKKPNAWGLFDMHGNVQEWCLDHYRKGADAAMAGVTLAPFRLPTADRFPHVVRGGSYFDDPAGCRSAARRASDPKWNRSDPTRPASIWWLADEDTVGFRVVRAVEEYPELKGIRSKVTKKSN
jgi:formylglycine-generating enzyme required for sulfatase activity